MDDESNIKAAVINTFAMVAFVVMLASTGFPVGGANVVSNEALAGDYQCLNEERVFLDLNCPDCEESNDCQNCCDSLSNVEDLAQCLTICEKNN